MNNNPEVHKAAKAFYNALKDMGLQNPVIIYSYEFGDDDNDGVRGGWYGGQNEVLGACERTKFNLLNNKYEE
jgi:hypothetical protein